MVNTYWRDSRFLCKLPPPPHMPKAERQKLDAKLGGRAGMYVQPSSAVRHEDRSVPATEASPEASPAPLPVPPRVHPLLTPREKWHVDLTKYPEGIESSEASTRASECLLEYGVVVITGVYSDALCDKITSRVESHFEKLTGRSIDDDCQEQTPIQTRKGLMQALLSNLPEHNIVRSDPRLKKLWRRLYKKLRKARPIRGLPPVDDQTDMVVTGDGINLLSRNYFSTSRADWAHLDQVAEGITRCIQGQLVLRNSSACFRASPCSHLVFEEIMKLCGFKRTNAMSSQWGKIPADLIEAVKELVLSVGGEYQVPIRSPKGSLVLWLSSVIHSASHPTEPVPIADPYANGRLVFYVCFRPFRELDKRNLNTLVRAILENRTTNHWGAKLFGKVPGLHGAKLLKTRDPRIQEFHEDPTRVYSIVRPFPTHWSDKKIRSFLELRGVRDILLRNRCIAACCGPRPPFVPPSARAFPVGPALAPSPAPGEKAEEMM